MSRSWILLKNIGFRPVSTLVHILLLTIFFTGILLSSAVCNAALDTQDTVLNKTLEARTLSVFPSTQGVLITENDRNAIEEMPHVLAVVPSSARIYGGNVQIGGNSEQTYPSVFVGTNAAVLSKFEELSDQSLQDNQVLVPKILIDENGQQIDGTSLIGKTISAAVNRYDFSETEEPAVTEAFQRELTVIGCYQGKLLNGFENQILASFDTVLSMNAMQMNTNSEEHTNLSDCLVFVDDYANTTGVTLSLEQRGYLSSVFFDFNKDVVDIMILGGSTLTILSFVMATLLTFLLQMRCISKRMTEIGLMKSMGFQTKHIFIALLIQAELISILSFVFSFVVSEFVSLQFGPAIFTDYAKMSCFGMSGLICVFVAFLVPFLTILLSLYKIRKISPSVALKQVG